MEGGGGARHAMSFKDQREGILVFPQALLAKPTSPKTQIQNPKSFPS